jgi:hypothetical protein
MAIGDTSKIESSDKDKIEDVVKKVRDLNARLQDVKREQVFQREREAEFRDISESVNGRVVRWTLLQLAVLGITCAWQLSYLRAFFIKLPTSDERIKTRTRKAEEECVLCDCFRFIIYVGPPVMFIKIVLPLGHFSKTHLAFTI